MGSIRIAACLLWVLAAACGTDGGERARSHPPGGGSGFGVRAAVVSGTVLDAGSGEPVAGIAVEGPGGVRATTDSRGRFTLSGLPVGAGGEIVARAKDGRVARNPLRPLRADILEVVLHLRLP